MARSKVLLLGSGGETGSSTLSDLLDHGEIEVIALIRPASANKPFALKLKERGVEVQIGDATDEIEVLIAILKDIDVVISAISAESQLAQLALVTAAKQAGVKRFVPCGFITVAPAGGVMELRDQKEAVYQHIHHLSLPYTIIDVGYWYQISFPAVPSGKVGYAILRPNDTAMVDVGIVKTGITDLMDVGRFVALVINGARTLNHMVYLFGEVMSQREIFILLEEIGGERFEPQIITGTQLQAYIAATKEQRIAELEHPTHRMMLYGLEYLYCKFVRGDNTPEVAKGLGYLSATELYPEVTLLSFRAYLQLLVDGKGCRPYPELSL